MILSEDPSERWPKVAAGGSVREAFLYDPMGNWETGGRSHDPANRILSDVNGSYDHDADGNLTAETDPATGPRTYAYDALGRLESVQTPAGATTYRYDALGRRYAMTAAAGTTLTLFDREQEIGTVEPGGQRRAYLSIREFRLAAEGPVYVHAGLEGSVLALTDTSGDFLEHYRYTAFGEVTVTGESGTPLATQPEPLSPWLFHGRLHEPETGLYWMRARHYHPGLGRFLQPDPIGIAGGANLYAYANNNPLRWFDPWGLKPETAEEAVNCRKLANAITSLSQEVRNLIDQMGQLNDESEAAVNIAAAGLAVELGLAATGINGIKSVGQRAFKNSVKQANRRARSGGSPFSNADRRAADLAGLNAAGGAAKKSLGTAAAMAALGFSAAEAANLVANSRIDSADQKSRDLFNTIKGLQSAQKGLMVIEDESCN